MCDHEWLYDTTPMCLVCDHKCCTSCSGPLGRVQDDIYTLTNERGEPMFKTPRTVIKKTPKTVVKKTAKVEDAPELTPKLQPEPEQMHSHDGGQEETSGT